TQSYLIGKKEVFWAPTSHLERAKLGVITVETDDGIKNAHRPVIQFLNRDVPMSPFFVSGGFDSDRNRAGFVVDRVNTFVNNPSETYLSVRFDRDRSLDSYGVGGFMIFMGFLFMYTAISSHVKYFLIVDRSQRKVICKKEYLVLPPEIEEWHFRDIADVELVVKTDNDDIESYSSEICLHSSECVPILLGFSNKEKLQESLSKIRQMLK
ncbi:MAG: hypothetical protein SVX43_22840, partial [Cyanobacteriota bacterium]|nr:hypothetical protein [Cyanobacteriota bacterium]